MKDLINTSSFKLRDMLGQTAESKMEKFVDTMPTIIQTHLITCENWEKTTKKAKELEHIIRKCDPPAAALPTLTQGNHGLYNNPHRSYQQDNKYGQFRGRSCGCGGNYCGCSHGRSNY